MIRKSLRQSVLTYIRRGVQYTSGLFPKLKIPLANSLVPVGQSTPTFSRSTAATVTDFEGIICTANINELRFPGARRVENLLSSTEVLSTQTVTVVSGSSYILSFSGTGSVTFSGAATGTLIGSTGRVQVTKTATTASLTLTVSGSVLQAQLERVTGTQTVASEYVSSGVLSSPYHGAGIDAVKYFTTDRSGNALSTNGALIEPASTNLFLNSSTPVTQNITVVNGKSYTVWGTGTGSVVLSGAGSGTVTSSSPRTFTATGTTLICTVTNMNTVQVELGVKTSYIPTSGTSVTRTADILIYDVEDTITQGQGSLYCEFTLNSTQSGYYRLLYLSNGTTSNRIYIYVNTGGAISTIVVASGVTTGSLNGSLNASFEGVIYKVMLTYEENNMKLYANGELIASDSSGAIPTISPAYLNIGSHYGGSYSAIGKFKNVKYFKEVLSESQAIRMTS